MAPTFEHIGLTQVTHITYPVYTNSSYNYRTGRYDAPYRSIKKVETKKQRIMRIAKEKMLASWKLYNQKTEKIFEIKQICKPEHRVGYFGVRNKK